MAGFSLNQGEILGIGHIRDTGHTVFSSFSGIVQGEPVEAHAIHPSIADHEDVDYPDAQFGLDSFGRPVNHAAGQDILGLPIDTLCPEGYSEATVVANGLPSVIRL